MWLARFGVLGAWVAGALLVADAVLHGRASLALVVIVPVFFGGSSEFLLGVVLLVVGFFLVPLALWEPSESEPLRPVPVGPRPTPPSAEVAGGGVVLIGPVPLFFGGWKNVSRRVRLLLAIVGGTVLVLLVVGYVLAVR
jgi:uncharacterized protein (TIGR00304 family)